VLRGRPRDFKRFREVTDGKGRNRGKTKTKNAEKGERPETKSNYLSKSERMVYQKKGSVPFRRLQGGP